VPPPSLPLLDGVEHRTVAARGIEMHVAEMGAGPPLVLLHGWPQHWFMWRRVMPDLAAHYRVIAPDLPGLGWSGVPTRGYEKETLAADVLGLLDALDLDRVRLAGHDWGGFVGFLLCLHHPERFERYLALNITHPWVRSDVRIWGPALPHLWYMALLASPVAGPAVLQRAPAFVRRLLRSGGGHGEDWSETELDAFADVLRQPERARASQAYYRSFLLREFGPALRGRYRDARLEVPTLLLFGEEDYAIPAASLGEPPKQADDMRIELVPGVGHFIAEQAPELVLDRAIDFFSGESVAAGR